MEKIAKVSYDFIDYNPNDKGLFGDHVIAEMTEHASVFDDPDVPIADLTTVNTALKGKTQEAMSGDKVKIQERDEAEKAWDTKFRKEAEYVQRIASGNKLVIAQSGYHATKTEIHPLAKPATPILQAWGNKGKGSIHAEILPLADTRGIVFLAAGKGALANMSVDGQIVKVKGQGVDEINALFGTKRKVDFVNLTSGQEYEITAFAFNATGVSDMAAPVSVIAP